MRNYRTAVLAGIAALAAAGVGYAAGRDTHVMKVGLPDGSVARIEYKDDVAPTVSFGSPVGVVPAGLLAPVAGSPFDAFDRVAAEMDRQAQAMIHALSALQAASLPADGKVDPAMRAKLPPGTTRYQFISMNDGRTCNRTIKVTYNRDKKPSIVSASSGDCEAAARAPAPAQSKVGHAPAASKA